MGASLRKPKVFGRTLEVFGLTEVEVTVTYFSDTRMLELSAKESVVLVSLSRNTSLQYSHCLVTQALPPLNFSLKPDPSPQPPSKDPCTAHPPGPLTS